MIKTRLFRLFHKSLTKTKGKLIAYWFQLPLAIFFFLLGFSIATGLGTLFAQTQQWQVFDAFFLVITSEMIQKYFYHSKQRFLFFSKKKAISAGKNFFNNLNYLKIGIIFGFFVDAFKLGS